jgi:hypothetical protein
MQKSNLQVGSEVIILAGRLPEEIRVAGREGLPLSTKDLTRRPQVASNANAAPFYRQARALYSDDDTQGKQSNTLLKSLREATRPADILVAKRHLQSQSKLLGLATQAVQKPHCDFNRHWEQGTNLLLPELAPLREMARLLIIKSYIALAENRPVDALKIISDAIRIGNHAGEGLSLIERLVQFAVHHIAYFALLKVLKQAGTRPEVLTQARTTVALFPKHYPMRQNFGSEVIMCRMNLAALRRGEVWAGMTDSFSKMSSPVRKVMIDGGEARLLQCWRALYKEEEKSQGSMRLFLSGSQRILGQYLDQKNNLNWVTAIFLPDFPLMLQKCMRNEAYTALLQNMIMLLEQKRSSGTFPSKPNLLTDPSTGTPLRYGLQGNGFVLWSVGINQKEGNLVISYP